MTDLTTTIRYIDECVARYRGRQPYIQKLNHDILHQIITIQTDMFSDPDALNTAVSMSQVCRFWRNTTLTTSTVWAKLFDLDDPLFLSTEWRTEIVRRSGQALLWIKADNLSLDDDPEFAHFFFQLIRKHWSRVQKLVVQVNPGDSDLSMHQLAPFFRRAPQLMTLNFTILGKEENIPDSYLDCKSLFSHDAPLLRTLKLYPCNFQLSIGDSWHGNLVDLTLHNPLCVLRILDILAYTPLLQSLNIINAISTERPVDKLASINLSRLTSLKLDMQLDSCSILLALLSPSPTCSFSYTPYESQECYETESEPSFIHLMKRVGDLASSYFSFHRPTKIALDYDANLLLSFSDETDPGTQFFFRFSVYFVNSNLSFIRTFLRTFATPFLSSATHLRIQGPKEIPYKHLRRFITYLPNLQTLYTTEKLLCGLVKAKRSGDVLFPLLKTLLLFDLGLTDDNKNLINFVRSRERKLRCLDLTRCRIWDVDDLLIFLRGFEMKLGVNVVWFERDGKRTTKSL